MLEKGVAALQELKQRRLCLLYLGVESGSTAVLKRVHKGAAHKAIVNALECAAAAGVKVSATMILGLGGQDDWEEHIAQSAALINRAPLTYLSTLQLTLHDDAARAEFLSGQEAMFRFQDEAVILAEQQRLLQLLEPPRSVIFRSNHASNYLPLAGTLPKDKAALLATVGLARSGARRCDRSGRAAFEAAGPNSRARGRAPCSPIIEETSLPDLREADALQSVESEEGFAGAASGAGMGDRVLKPLQREHGADPGL